LHRRTEGAHRALAFPDFCGLPIGLGLEAYSKRIAQEAGQGEGGKCKLIKFPIPEAKPKNAGEGLENKPDYSDFLKNFGHSGFADYKFVGGKILWALYFLRINSLEELANTPPSKIKSQRNIGEKALSIIKAVLKKNGLVPCREWETALRETR
jgi:hypothetical protein